MLERYISKPNLKKILERLIKNTNLVAPIKAHGEVMLEEVKSADDIVFDYVNSLNAPKDYMLLNDDALFKYNNKTLRIKKDAKADFPLVIFGSRPCDTRAVGLLDKFFSRKFEDPRYFEKRKSILLITLACGKLGRKCFCTSTKSGPYLENGFDVQLIETGDGYFAEALSENGKRFVKQFSNLMSGVNAEKKKEKKRAVQQAIESKEIEFDLKKVYENLGKSNVKDELWQDLKARCQSCGGCLLICPTCSCFYVVDKMINDKEGERVRSLDACYYEGFTRMAGGYNPVSPETLMMKRKFYHKLWQQMDEFDEPGCTGCGRCSDICPGNINWLEYIKRIEKKQP